MSPHDGPAVLVADALTVTYGAVTALADVGLAVPAGGFLAVTGASGAGKTTLLLALAGALRPTRGQVVHAGTAVTDRHRAAAAGIALVPQGNALVSTLTGRENIVLALLALGVPAGQAGPRADAALADVGLADWAGHLVEEYSGGQQQRVAVARALAAEPAVLLADEPTSDLDAANRERVIALLRARARAGAAVVMTTHDPEAAAHADRVVHLDEGRLGAAD